MINLRILILFVFLTISVTAAEALDEQTSQVLIESKIVEVHQDISRELGIDYQFLYQDRNGQKTLEVQALALGTQAGASQGSDPTRWITESPQLIINLKTIEPDSTEIFFTALKSSQDNNLLVGPRIVDLEGNDEECDSVSSASPKEGSSNYDKVLSAGTGTYDSVHRQVSDIYGGSGLRINVDNYPASGETDKMVARGLKSKFTIPSGIPNLSDTPVLSMLFRTAIRDTDKGNLLVVVTPLIVKDLDE